MAGTYSRVVEATTTGGVSNCIDLPMPARGTLDRLILKQTAGADVDFDYTVYNRKGACPAGNDLHVNAGTVVSIGNNNGSQFTITHDQFEPYGYKLQVGDKLWVKGVSPSGYNSTGGNGPHTIVSVDNAAGTLITTNFSYIGAGLYGYWQDNDPKVFPIHDPTMHLVMAENTGTSGNASANFDMNRIYENDDNQDFTKRTQATSLWLDLQPAGSGSKTFEVAYTVNVEFKF